MQSRFLQLFTSLDKAHFGALTALHAGSGIGTDQRIRPSDILTRGRFSSLRDIVITRQGAHRFRLGTLDSSGPPNIASSLLSDAIQGFFTNEPVQPEARRRSKAVDCDMKSFDVRQIAQVRLGNAGDDTIIYCCRYREESEQFRKTTNDDDYGYFGSRPRSRAYAIPSSAGIHDYVAPSLISPLSMSPREHISRGEAGAIFCFSPNSMKYVADLYWSKLAFMDSLEHVQEIGRTLIALDAPGEAARTGVGFHDFHRASAILTKVYDAVAQIGQDEAVRFFTCGIWGVAIQPKTTGGFVCQIGVAATEHGLECEKPLDPNVTNQLLTESDRKLVVVKFDLRQDRFGFLQLFPEAVHKSPVEPVTWYDTLPSLN